MPNYVPISGNVRSGSAPTSQQLAVTKPGKASYGWQSSNDAELYRQWGNLYTEYDDAALLNNYFDYFYSGQDIQVYIEGLYDPEDVMPIYQFGYSVQQQKTPIYGFWSYTFDTVLRGNRIITGAFSVIAPSPGFVRDKVAKAASVRSRRANSNTLSPIRGLDQDEQNIQTYWRRNYDSNLDAGQQHLFSVHPPFNFIIKYGMQDTSLEGKTPNARSAEIKKMFSESTAMMSDINERIVEVDPDNSKTSVLLENVELVSRQTEYTPEGDPVLETYSFIARDIREAVGIQVSTNKGTTVPSSNSSSSGGGVAKTPV